MSHPTHCSGRTSHGFKGTAAVAGAFGSEVVAERRIHAPPPADQLTAQCTDQCVVIACSNPDHPESICPRTGPHTQCDFVCDEEDDCADCHGFDAFLQCCDDYHPYNGTAAPPATTSSAWETAFAAWCAACAEPPPLPGTMVPTRGVSDKAIANSVNGGTSTQASPKLSMQMHHHQSSSMNDFVPVDETFVQQSPTPSAAPSQAEEFSCMWAACNATFTSLSELVGHVNLDHLAHSSSSSTPSSSLSEIDMSRSNFQTNPNGIEHNISPISCLWDNCGSSYFPTSDNSFELLANHLLNEHLGADPLLLATQSYQQQLQREMQHQQSQQRPHRHQHNHSHLHQLQHHNQHQNDDHQEAQQHRIDSYEAQMHEQLQQFAGPSKLPDPATPPLPITNHPSPFSTQSDFDQTMRVSAPLSQIIPPQKTACSAGAPHTHECRWKACGATFDSCDALTAHISDVHIGSGKARYECFWEECARNGALGFQSKQKISRHVQSHTGHRPFQCSICHQNFSEAATLQQHTRRHTQEKPYVCDHPGCGKSFAITGALTIHKRTHNGDKPFKCSYCDRGFAESSNLSKHLRTHTGARPYICTEVGCGKAFARPDQLNRHKSVHKKQARGVGGRATIEA